MEVDHQSMTEVFPIPVQGLLSEVTAMYQPYVEKLFDTNTAKVMEGLREIKNFVIGNNKQKTNFIILGAVPRLVYLMQDDTMSIQLRTEATVVIGSLAKGIDTNVKNLLDHGVIEAMCACLGTPDLKFYEACIRCLRTMVISSESSSKLLYINPVVVIPQMLENINRSTCTQECTCEIISQCCSAEDHQNLLLSLEIIPLLGDLLVTGVIRVKVKALNALSILCYRNLAVCRHCASAKIGDKTLVEILVKLLAQVETTDIQLRAAKCLTFMFRTGVLKAESYSCVIIRKVLPCLVRMCDSECTTEERVCGAETIAYLTEVDPPLQRLAYICEQFPHKLEAYFKHPTVGDTKNTAEMKRFKHELKHGHELRRAGFLAYASLLSNDEDIRKQVATETLVNHVAEAITDNCVSVRVTSLKCLLSLSRSVQLLRTTFQDVGVWKALLKLVKDSKLDVEETQVISCVMCNLMLDFCPSKPELREAGLLRTICEWTNMEPLKLNAIWALMNMTFHADVSTKLEVLETLGFEQIYKLLSDSSRDVIIRTLGLLRNVLSTDDEKIMAQYSVNIVQACKHVLTAFCEAGAGDPSLHAEYEKIRAHAVCVLACIAGGEGASAAKTYLQNQSEMLQQMVSYLAHFDPHLQMAAVTFIHNFVRMEHGCIERQTVMTDLGALSGLQQLRSTTDRVLFDKVEETLNQFENTKM